jgi:hypothetical protein
VSLVFRGSPRLLPGKFIRTTSWRRASRSRTGDRTNDPPSSVCVAYVRLQHAHLQLACSGRGYGEKRHPQPRGAIGYQCHGLNLVGQTHRHEWESMRLGVIPVTFHPPIKDSPRLHLQSQWRVGVQGWPTDGTGRSLRVKLISGCAASRTNA